MKIRTAEAADADEACVVLRRSIEELCLADHHGDKATLQGWLANKNTATFLSWLSSNDQRIFLAVQGDVIAGVGAVGRDGEIRLNYVSPDFRFKGASTALLGAMEAFLKINGCDVSRLCSTVTARAFYLARGYEDSDPPEPSRRLSARPMAKHL